MKIVLSGGEKGTYRSVLIENKVNNIAVNVTQFQVPKRKEVNLKELLGGANAFVYTSDDDEDVAKFDEFVRTHVDDIECVIGRADYDGTWLGAKYVPLWNDEKDLERLAYLCEKYGRVAISDRAITTRTQPRIRQLQQRWGCTLVGLTSKIDVIEALPWDVVIVSSWTSVARYGETQVWDGHALRRYPSQKKESARKSNRAAIVRLGIDYDAVIDDDVKEVQRLAVRSWQAWEQSTYGEASPAAYHPFEGLDDDEFEGPSEGEVATTFSQTLEVAKPEQRGVAIATQTPDTRTESERRLLPVVGFESVVSIGTHTGSNPDDTYEIDPKAEQVIRYNNDGIRVCDSCYLAPKCPAFKEHASCAFNLPVELKTKEQLRGVLRAMLEMQTNRILFARFAEELEGQTMDPNVSHEMDRLFRLTKEFKDIEDTRDMVKFELEARGGAGVLERIFGSKAAEKVNQLDTPMDQKALDQFILDADVLD